jgi:peptidoglycan hydrolase CwlO-like protein
MLTDEAAVKLHHRASLGEKLTPEEGAALEAWYAKQDAEEAAALAKAGPSADIAALRAQVNATLTRIATMALRIKRMNEENERLRQEIAVLHQKLAEKQRAQPA